MINLFFIKEIQPLIDREIVAFRFFRVRRIVLRTIRLRKKLMWRHQRASMRTCKISDFGIGAYNDRVLRIANSCDKRFNDGVGGLLLRESDGNLFM